jgi:hypothetical protein
MGLGPSLTLQATVNPDFGQVELDPAEVNLSAFETFFSEKRPFFVEGTQLLQGAGSYFYSRRIGARPRGPVEGDYVDYPQASSILGAAKLTGRLASGASIGALAAVTDYEYARTFDSVSIRFSRTQVAPTAAYGVARAQKEFGRSASTVGDPLKDPRCTVPISMPGRKARSVPLAGERHDACTCDRRKPRTEGAMKRFDGQVAIVTGAARGIGAATARPDVAWTDRALRAPHHARRRDRTGVARGRVDGGRVGARIDCRRARGAPERHGRRRRVRAPHGVTA